MSRIAIAAALALCLAPQEPGPLQKSLADLEVKGPWHYNDLAGGFAEAKKTGKPLLITFR
jgi:hypothetical protein